MNAQIVLLPGDGIGPEVVAEAVRVLQWIAGKQGHQFTFSEHLIGGCSIDRHGTALTPAALEVRELQTALIRQGIDVGSAAEKLAAQPA